MDLAIYTVKAVAQAIVGSGYTTILIMLSLILYFQNRKTAVMQKAIIGESINSPLELTISQVVLGILGGALGSILLTYSGVMFDEKSGIELIFLTSVVLTLVKPRFICFAYSGAVLGALSLLTNDIYIYFTGKPALEGFLKLDITALMTMVGILHIVEGLLVALDGNRGAIPVFSNTNGKIAGGYALKRYWPIPVVLMLLTVVTAGDGTDVSTTTIMTPDWWPVIKTSHAAKLLETAVLAAAPIYAMLGYSSVTFTKTKREKALSSGLYIFIYGIVLTAVAQLARFDNIVISLFVVAFAPLAHELMLKLQALKEVRGKAKYVSDEDGIVVLEVAPNSPAAHMGIKAGDRLMEINNRIIESEKDVLEGIKQTLGKMEVKIKQVNGAVKELQYGTFAAGQRLGVVFVPRYVPKEGMVMGYENMKFKDFMDKIQENDEDEDEDENNED
ncbi:PDZ domain-containing protein [Clostridium thermarum]|uniref:PDZ domain-containing protein n=1 Tax=Clostridium thermarum TaxID=1716543 RepID=UPI00111E1494|nr:PDZ domain-containing protein [Clostridium thermarum]